jgi:hypothetical protein
MLNYMCVCIIVSFLCADDIKDDTIGIYFYAKHVSVNSKNKVDCFGVRIMCLSGAGHI